MSWSELRGERGPAASPGWRFQLFSLSSPEGRTAPQPDWDGNPVRPSAWLGLSREALRRANLAGTSHTLPAHKLQRFSPARENTRLLVTGWNIRLRADGGP